MSNQSQKRKITDVAARVHKPLDQNLMKKLINKAVQCWKAKYKQEISALKIEIQEIKESQK